MATTQEYLSQLQTDKQTLVDNLVTKGVSASNNETFTSLVPKVLDIPSGSNIEITDASYLFYGGARLNNLEILLDACKNVTSCVSMFQSCTSLTSLDVSGIVTSNCTKLEGMFLNAKNLESLDCSSFDTSNVTTMNLIFSQCSGLTSINVANWDTSKVTNFSQAFYKCTSLTKLDISSFTSDAVTISQFMFAWCTNLTKLIIDRQDIFKMTNTNMFNNSAIANGTGYVYVPDNMVETYKSATNWSTYADQIKGMSELPVGDE